MEFNEQDENEPICQDEILDSLFFGCDTDSTGLVKVSKLIEYLSLSVTDDNVEFSGNFDNLLFLLDPVGRDEEIDIETYRKGMEDWIDGIRCQSYNEEISEIQNSSLYSDECSRMTTQGNASLSRSGIKGDSSMNNSSESVEGVGGESPQKQDWELVSKIEDLQLNNKRLVEHNAELSCQMENTDDTNGQLLQEVDNLQKQLRSYQNLDEKNKSIEKENEELRQTVIELQETSKNVRNKAKQLEKDKMALNEFQEELQTKLSAARRRLDSLSNDHNSVCVAYNEEKQKLVELEELQGVKEEIDKESTNKQDYLTNVIAELTAQKEALQMEKNKMEAELFHIREDLSRLVVHNATTLAPERQSIYRTPGKSFSTVSSLQQEIQELSCDDCLPSPLVGYSTFLSNCYESDVFDSSHYSQNQTSSLLLSSLNSSVTSSHDSKSSEVLTAATQVAVDFRAKKEKALHAIAELVRLDKTRETKEIREGLQNELEKELEFFAEKIRLLLLSRKTAEKRVSKLLSLIETLKGENKQLVEERDKALQKTRHISFTGDDLETKVESLTTKLKATSEKVETLAKRCAGLQSEINEANSELQCTKLENETLASSLETKSNARRESERQFQDIARLHNDLQKDHRNSLAKISKLEREFERTSSNLTLEKKRAFNLQESLSMSVSKHEQELQDIMETIPNTTYTEINSKLSKSKSKPSALTGYQVKTRLQNFIVKKNLTIRDSPDGKPTSHEDEVPLGVSTPLGGSSTELNTRRPFQCQLTDISQGLLNENSKDSLGDDVSGNSNSWNSTDDGRSCTDSSTSFISPNLVRPFEVDTDSGSSPNLVHPFEGNRKTNVTFTKDTKGTQELEENSSKGNAVASPSFNGGESEVNYTQSLGVESSSENCKRNLAGDFSVEAKRCPNRTASLSSCQYSDDSGDTNNNNDGPLPAAPLSPQVPQRFLECPKRKNSATEVPTRIIKTESQEEFQESQAASKEASSDHDGGSEETSKETPMFLFDNLDIERCSQRSNGLSGCQRLACSPCDGDFAFEGYDSDYRSSPSIVNSYIEGVSLNSNLPSDEIELEKLFKSVSLAFRTDKTTLTQRLEYQERVRGTAESNVVKGLQSLSSGIKDFEKTNSNRQALKKSQDSLYEQIKLLKECSRRLSTQSHQFGCYQQEARMMSGVDVLITYGETLSRRFETLSESVSSKEAEEDYRDSPRMQGKKISIAQEEGLTRRGSAFYNFMASMRPKDAFGLFGSGEAPEAEKELGGGTEQEVEEENDVGDEENEEPLEKDIETEQVYDNVRNKTVRERSCLNRCFHWSIRLIMFVVLFGLFIFIGIEYSVIDRDFVVEQLHKNLNRFEVKLYGQEPAI